MEESIRYHEYYDKVRIIYKNNKIIGYVCSEAEAEAICKKNELYQWDIIRKKHEKIIDILNQLTIHDIQ